MDTVLIEALASVKHSTIRNYGIPGLHSSLLNAEAQQGMVRLFECSHSHQAPITPHSHRFDFQCLVLTGTVTNRTWTKNSSGSTYLESRLIYGGEAGSYQGKEPVNTSRYAYTDAHYVAGDVYGMRAEDIHSIYFSEGAQVLFLEGEQRQSTSVILEPVVDDELIPTFKVEPWMFQKPAPKEAP